MRLQAMLCVLVLAGCATARSGVQANLAGQDGSGDTSRGATEPVRLETSVGTFLVQPSHAEDFARLLSGEPTQQQYYSISDVP